MSTTSQRVSAHLKALIDSDLSVTTNRLILADALHDAGRELESERARDLDAIVVNVKGTIVDVVATLKANPGDKVTRWAYAKTLRKTNSIASDVQYRLGNKDLLHPMTIGVERIDRKKNDVRANVAWHQHVTLDTVGQATWTALWCPKLLVYVESVSVLKGELDNLMLVCQATHNSYFVDYADLYGISYALPALTLATRAKGWLLKIREV